MLFTQLHKHQVVFIGLGFSISLPASSHDMLKSLRTSRVLDVMIEAAITRLCTPINNMNTEKHKYVTGQNFLRRKDLIDLRMI